MKVCSRLIVLITLMLPLSLYAQTYTFSPPRGCGLGNTTNGIPPLQSYGTPAVYSWEWGLDGRFSNITGTADQKNFYNWAKDPTKSGEYVLARVEYDINTIYNGRMVSDGGLNSSLSCYSQGVGIRFMPKTRDYSTEEMLGIYLNGGGVGVATVQFSTTIGGVSVVGKQMGVLRAGSASLTLGVAGYFNSSRNIGSGGTVALPGTPTIVSGGQVPLQGIGYYLLGGGQATYNDAVFPSGFDGWWRIGACATQSPNAFCTYGKVPAGNAKPSFAENKRWRFDYVAYKAAGVTFVAPAMKDTMLPYIAIGRMYLFGTNGANTYGGAGTSPTQMSLCIAGMSSYPDTSSRGCAAVAPTDPPPPAPYNPTCYTVLRGGTVEAGNKLVTELDTIQFSDFTGSSSGLRYTQSTGTNKRLEIGINCINNNNTIPANVKLTITDTTTTCDTEITGRRAKGILCNTAINAMGNPAAKAHIQIFRALKSNASLACSSINTLGVTGNTSFETLPISQTVPTASLNSSYYSPLGDNNTYLWQFCARYITSKTSATDVGPGSVKGEFNFTFDYD